MRPAEIVVVGGGFAGLAAATTLAERGVRVTLLEARPALGGRAAAYRDPGTGEWVDNGQHVLLGCYDETFTFLRRVGTDRLVRIDDTLSADLVDRAGRRSRLACPSLPSPLHLLAGVLAWDGVPWRDRLAVLRLAAPLLRARNPGTDRRIWGRIWGRAEFSAAEERAGFSEDFRSSVAENAPIQPVPNSETVAEWLRRHRQPAALVELLWEPLALAALNQPIDRAAAAPFARVLGRMFGSDRRAASMARPMVPLSHLYAEPARAWLEQRGSTVRTSAPARIIVTDGRVSHVAVGHETMSAGGVVCAVPWFAMGRTLEGAAGELAATVGNAARTAPSPIVTVNLWFDRPVLDVPFLGLPGRTFQWVFDKRRAFGDSASHLSLVSSGADAVVAMSNDALVDRATSELRTALPSMGGALVRRGTVIRERRATFSIAPGQPPRPGTRTDVEGLVLAGDWIDTGLPATIESAVESGHRAAAALIA